MSVTTSGGWEEGGGGDASLPLSKSGGTTPVLFKGGKTALSAKMVDFQSRGRNTPL